MNKKDDFLVFSTGSLSESVKAETIHIRMAVPQGAILNWGEQSHTLTFPPLISLFSNIVIC